jgi:hypothetical protein
MTRRGGTVDSPGRRTGLGTVGQVEQVESESAVVAGGGLAWQKFAVHAKLYISVVLPVFWRCTPAMSVSSMTPSRARGYYRRQGLQFCE